MHLPPIGASQPHAELLTWSIKFLGFWCLNVSPVELRKSQFAKRKSSNSSVTFFSTRTTFSLSRAIFVFIKTENIEIFCRAREILRTKNKQKWFMHLLKKTLVFFKMDTTFNLIYHKTNIFLVMRTEITENALKEWGKIRAKNGTKMIHFPLPWRKCRRPLFVAA